MERIKGGCDFVVCLYFLKCFMLYYILYNKNSFYNFLGKLMGMVSILPTRKHSGNIPSFCIFKI